MKPDSRLIWLVSLLVSMAPATAEHYRVYLLGGQSNGNGRADAAQLPPPLASPQSDVRFYWHRTQPADNVGHLAEDQWIDLAPGSGHGTGEPVHPKEFGSEVSFGRAMADADPAARVAIIKYTHGGTSLHQHWSASGIQYTTFVSTVQAGLAALANAGHTYDLRGMLWQQGETDTLSATSADSYQANLTSLIARVRNDLAGGKPLPFVIGSLSNSQFSDIATPGTNPYKVRQAQMAVAAADPTVGIVITDGYTVRSDVIHFDHRSQIALGREFAAHMRALQPAGTPSCSSRPNIIFVLGDDQAWYDYGFMYRSDVEKTALDANPAIRQVARTPALDRLAREGLAFTHGYSTPLCRPSLASMITGTFPHQSWITGNDPLNNMPDEAVEARMQVLHPLPHTLATRLGYTSFQTGKWWEGHHRNGGFTAGDTVNSTAAGTQPPQWSGPMPSYVTARHGDWGLMTGRVDYVNDVASPAHPIPYASTVKTATDFIDTQVSAGQPFFLWYAPFLPHFPHDPPAGLLAQYTAMGLSSADANYYANVERFDGGVGALLDHLDAKGIADNTMVVTICDNGRDMPRGKRTSYEGGIRTPIIVRWPERIRPGAAIEPRVVTTPVSLIDMVPTVHHAVGLPVFPEMTGVNLLDLAAVATRDTIFMENSELQIMDLPNPLQSLTSRIAIRNGWKLILPYNRSTGTNGTPELYRLYDTTSGAPADPFENTNLAAANPVLVSELTTAIEQWYQSPKGQAVTTTEAAGFTVAGDDLLQTSLAASSPVVTTGNFTEVAGVAVAGEPALRNGIWDNDGSGRANAGAGNGASATYHFDLASSPLGYTIHEIHLYSNWGPNPTNDEIRVSIDYSVAASPTNFDNHVVINAAYNPPTLSQGKMSITNIGASGVAAIRFTWPANQEGGAVGYSELDVIGIADGDDTTPPRVTGLSPARGADKAPVAGELSVGFCEPIHPGTGFIRLFNANGSLVESFDVANSPRIAIRDTRLAIDPTDGLARGASYYVTIDPGALVDARGNAYPGLSAIPPDSQAWSFITDGTSPTVQLLQPANGATGIQPPATLTLGFDEEVRLGSGHIRIFQANGTQVQSIDVNGGAVTINGTQVSISISNLALGTAYDVTIDSGAFTDLSGNPHAGISGTTGWTFTTATTTLIHHWEFEGNATDSVGTHHGTLSGNTTYAAGNTGQAASFDGNGDSITVNQSSLPATDFTLATWVKPSSTAGIFYVAGTQQSGNAGAFLRIDDGAAFVNLLPPAESKRATGGSIPAAAWTHLAATVSSSGGLKIYVNGNLVATDPTATGHTPWNNFRIGARPDGGTYGFNGLIDDLRIYASPLSAAEVAALAGGAAGKTKPPHHWELEGSSIDSGVPGGHHGTKQGTASYTIGNGGKFGEAVNLNGGSDGITSGAASLPATDFTLTAWVKPDTHAAQTYVAGTQVSSTSGAFIRIDNGVPFARTNGTAATVSGGTAPVGNWTHLAITVASATGLTLFVNGMPVANNPAGNSASIASNFTIGRRPDGTGGVSYPYLAFDGLIDDVAVFTKVLDNTQLANVIALGAGSSGEPVNDFTSWIANPDYGLASDVQGFHDDPDRDQLANGIEAWFGTHPGRFNTGLTCLTLNGTTTFTHPRNELPPSGLIGFYQWSPNLIDWFEGNGVDGPDGGLTVTISSSSVGTTTTLITTPSAPLQSLFLRAGVIED